MKLLMISGDRSLLRGQRGAFYYTLQELRKHWDRIDIICPRAAPSTQRPATVRASKGEQSIPRNVFFHPSPWRLLHQSLWIAERGRQLIAEHHHDVMTVHEYPPFYNGRGAVTLHRRTGVPFALEVHHIVGWPVAEGIAERIGYFLSRSMLPSESRASAGVRVVSSMIQEQLCSWGVPAQKIHIVPSFYLDRNVARQSLRPPKSYDIVCCARLVPNKGLDRVISALQYLPDERLLIIGDGPQRRLLERKVESLGVAGRVTFLGWLPTLEAVIGAVQTARVFVMPSLSEGGPRSALEAMAAGMPVIATRVGVMPEVIEDGVNGLFTDGSPKDIAQKVEHLLSSDELREQMGERAKTIIERFEKEKLVREYTEFLKTLASHSPS
jgi:glycosyltransferase involved in cell wall biosynthesis